MTPVDSYPSIPAAFFAASKLQPAAVAYGYATLSSDKSSPRPVAVRSYAEVEERVGKIAVFLSSLGVAPGSRVAILSNTRAEWVEADLGILVAGAATVSIYQSLPAEDVGYILFDSESEIVFAENQEQVDKLLLLQNSPIRIAGTEDRPEQSATLHLKRIICFEIVAPHPLVIQLEEILQQDVQAIPASWEKLKKDNLAALVYTSGTTGPPKGVIQSHGNHLANVRQAFDSGLVHAGSSITLFLPLAHSFAKLMAYIGLLSTARVYFPAVIDPSSSRADPQSILRDIRELSSEIVPVVPRFLEKMRDGIIMKARAKGLAAKLLRLALWSARKNWDAHHGKGSANFLVAIGYSGTKAIRQKIRRQLFGENFRLAVSGGAKLPSDVGLFFNCLGIDVIEGYGLTETCVATNVNPIHKNKIGTVGPVLSADIIQKIAPDGEILFRGPNVTSGYWKRTTATAVSWDSEGWFHTGDLGSVDSDGYLSIVGRKKEIIVTSGGKKIAPLDIEGQLKSLPLVSQAVLVGDGRPFCIALLTLDPVQIKDWTERMGISTDGNWWEDHRLHQTLWLGVEKLNTGLSSFETVKNILILPEDFSIENGLLTPTFKVKRKAVEQRFATQIDSLFKATTRTKD